MAGGLTGKVTLITGAGSGIGQAAAVRLAQEGGAFVLVGRREANLKETAGMLGGVDILIQSADIADPAAMDGVVRRHWRNTGDSICSSMRRGSMCRSVRWRIPRSRTIRR